MQIILNGEAMTVSPDLTLSALLQQLTLDPLGVAVAVNLHVVPRSQHGALPLKPGDRVDVIRAVGGG